MPVPHVRADVLLLAWIALALGSMAQGATGEQGWSRLQQYRGQVRSIRVDKCGQRPGLYGGRVMTGPPWLVSYSLTIKSDNHAFYTHQGGRSCHSNQR
jgi:hypothetical protein